MAGTGEAAGFCGLQPNGNMVRQTWVRESDGYPVQLILHHERVWHAGHWIHRLYGRPGSQSEIDRMRTTDSTSEILERTSHREQVRMTVPVSC